MATQNSINQKTTQLTIDPGASGDSYVQFDINTTNKFRVGIDDDDSDAFKIAIGNALGSSDSFRMSAAGEMTLPLQPGFVADCNAESNVTGDGTVHNVGSVAATTEIIDRTGDYNPGDGAGTAASFTAPITGYYMITGYLEYAPGAGGGTQFVYALAASNRSIIGVSLPTANQVASFYGVNTRLAPSNMTVVDMDAADTVTYQIQAGAGAKTDDIFRGTFSGILLQ